MLFLGSTPIGGPIVGWVSEQFGARYAIGLGAVAALGAGAWGMLQAQRAPAATVTEVILEPEVVAPVS
jgi:hypothetical protein